MSRLDDARFRAATAFQRHVGNPVLRRLPFQTLLETTGRVSGLPRRTPVGGRRVGNEFWLVSGGGIVPFEGDLDDYQRYLLDEAKRGRESARIPQERRAA